jgi:hypothetical protein
MSTLFFSMILVLLIGCKVQDFSGNTGNQATSNRNPNAADSTNTNNNPPNKDGNSSSTSGNDNVTNSNSSSSIESIDGDVSAKDKPLDLSDGIGKLDFKVENCIKAQLDRVTIEVAKVVLGPLCNREAAAIKAAAKDPRVGHVASKVSGCHFGVSTDSVGDKYKSVELMVQADARKSSANPVFKIPKGVSQVTIVRENPAFILVPSSVSCGNAVKSAALTYYGK